MEYFRRRRATVMDLELQHFWRMTAKGEALLRDNPLDEKLNEIHDEVELLAEMTDWPRIRDMCRRYLRMEANLRQPLARAGVA